MVERPILFQGAMVRALLAGTKTQTRRVVKPQPPSGVSSVYLPFAHEPNNWQGYAERDGQIHWYGRCPYGQPGDRLWVRETWQWNGGMMSAGDGYEQLYATYPADGSKRTIDCKGGEKVPQQPPQREGEVYSLRDAPADFAYDGENTYSDRLLKWWKRKIPAIHMPRWASRIQLEVTAVRVERLQDISEADAKAEGCDRIEEDEPGYVWREEHDWKLCPNCGGTGLYTAFGPNMGAMPDTDCRECDTYVKRYRHLWEAINGAGSWDANPWVWVVEFTRAAAALGEKK